MADSELCSGVSDCAAFAGGSQNIGIGGGSRLSGAVRLAVSPPGFLGQLVNALKSEHFLPVIGEHLPRRVSSSTIATEKHGERRESRRSTVVHAQLVNWLRGAGFEGKREQEQDARGNRSGGSFLSSTVVH